MPDASTEGRRNRLLAALPADTYEMAADRLQLVELGMRQPLFDADVPIEHVHFPLNAVASLVTPMSDGTAVEVATVGREGVVGLPVFLGAASLPMRCFAQVPGQALRMHVPAFRQLLADADGPFAIVLQRYTQTIFSQLAQNVACNQTHNLTQRCARWLLMTADRVDTPEFPLTQDFLAQMLGVRRAGVTEAAGRLAADGCIRYNHGVVTVVDRARLERVSCECYQVITTMLVRMLGDPAATAEATDDGRNPTLR